MLDVKLYQEVAAEPRFLNQAWITVLIYAMLASWGSFGRAGAVGSNIGLISAVIGWYVWAFSTYFCATKWFRETSAGAERGDEVVPVLGCRVQRQPQAPRSQRLVRRVADVARSFRRRPMAGGLENWWGRVGPQRLR